MSGRAWLWAAGMAAAACLASGETVTLPAAASVHGASPFYSDVRTFNTSYTETLAVTADYRCFIGTCGGAPQAFTLGPRVSRAFDDVCVSLFSSPDSAGAVEFAHAGPAGALVVTSRLYSTSPTPTVGMFVPGLAADAAHPVSILTSIRNGGSGAGFRTNVGVYNPGAASVDPTFKVYDGSTLLGTARLDGPLAPRSGAQINDVFARAGAASLATENASVVVDGGGGAVFAYAAVIDNATSDPILVLGAEDIAAPPPAGAQTVVVLVRAWDFSPGGPQSAPLRLSVGTTYTLVFRNADVAGTVHPQHGFSGVSELGLPPTDDISAGHDFVIENFTPEAWQRGTYPFVCTRSDCGGDPEQHAGMIGMLVVD